MATASGGGLVKEFLRLGLRLGRHVDSMVDAYYGPPELAETRAAKPVVPPERLVVEARRSSNDFPPHAFNSFFRSASSPTGTGTSGMMGGFIRSIGFTLTSPSPSSHLKDCWRLR